MTKHVITCKTTAPGKSSRKHRHIVGVGVSSPVRRWLATGDVLKMIAAGDTFVTKGKESHRTARVRGWPDETQGPGLRSFTDGVKDNNLRELPDCPKSE